MVIEYTPVDLSVSSMIIQLNVSQFNFNPVEIEVIGSSSPGIARESVVTHLKHVIEADIEIGPENGSSSSSESDEEAECGTQKKRDMSIVRRRLMTSMSKDTLNAIAKQKIIKYGDLDNVKRKGVGSGNVIDPGGEWVREKRKKAYENRKARLAAQTPPRDAVYA